MEIVATNKNDFQNMTLRIPDGTKVVRAKAFNSCNWFNTVIIPEGVSKIEEEAFANCKNLENLVIPSTLLEIGISAFNGCFKLDKLELKNVQIVGPHAFACCRNLTSVDIPHVKVVYYRAFYMCKKLESVTNATNVCVVRKEAFAHAGNITFIKFGEPLISIDDGAFKYSGVHCVSLENATQFKSLGKTVFQNCVFLALVNFAEQNKMKTLQNKTFRNCFNMKQIYLPEGMTTISSNAFENSAIREVTFPSTLKKIARRAFHNCSDFCIPILSVDVAVDPTSFIGCRPTSVFDLSNTKTQMNLTGEKCSICIEEFENENTVCKFKCGHVFHTECAKEWYFKSDTCANCRQEVKKVEAIERPTKRRKII